MPIMQSITVSVTAVSTDLFGIGVRNVNLVRWFHR